MIPSLHYERTLICISDGTNIEHSAPVNRIFKLLSITGKVVVVKVPPTHRCSVWHVQCCVRRSDSSLWGHLASKLSTSSLAELRNLSVMMRIKNESTVQWRRLASSVLYWKDYIYFCCEKWLASESFHVSIKWACLPVPVVPEVYVGMTYCLTLASNDTEISIFGTRSMSIFKMSSCSFACTTLWPSCNEQKYGSSWLQWVKLCLTIHTNSLATAAIVATTPVWFCISSSFSCQLCCCEFHHVGI